MRRWSFGAAAFDERAMQLFVGGRAVELELKPLEVLRYLLQRPREAVSKDDLVKAVWPGRIISDSALTSTIAKLREALGPEQDAIHTVHGFGYRLDAEVRAGDGSTPTGEGVASPPGRRLTAIMFTDLVGYSTLAHRDEPLAIELLELHRGWVREILPRHGGREIETIGDAFLVEFSGALAAVECAVAIQRRFAEYNAVAPEGRRMQLRIGIHAGDVEHKGGKVMGDGVNVASRIHGLAEPGGICVSEDVQRAVRPHGYRLESLGTPALKNIATPLELFKLSGIGDAPSAPVRHSPPPRTRWAVVGATLAVAVAVAIGGLSYREARPDRAPLIAVLPFDNLSAEPDSAYFTDGLHDTVIGHLSRVEGLRVISRTSVMGYRGKQANVRDIARELGADHILEGSVQRSGGRLRVAAQLIDTATDTHVWSSEYDRELADVFEVQADIARNVTAAVHARLTPQEQVSIESVPTRNQEAYDLYLRAWSAMRSPGGTPESAEALLDRAVALDPGFARAHVELAHVHDAMYWSGTDPSDERRRKFEQSVETALKLDPALAEAHIAKGLFLYHGSENYEAALAELEIARRLAPGNAGVHFWLAMIYRRQARWEEALAGLERATTLDPLSAGFLYTTAETLVMLRRYAEAAQALERLALVFRGDKSLSSRPLAYANFLRTGEVGPLDMALRGLSAELDRCFVSELRWKFDVLNRRYDQATAEVKACGENRLGDALFVGSTRGPKDFILARIQWHADGGKRPDLAARARVQLEQMLVDQPEWAAADVRTYLALAFLMLGDRDRALAEADRALATIPVSLDAVKGPDILKRVAEVHANAGEEQRALAELEQLLQLPAGVHVHEIRLDPMWDPLRDDPRFQQLIAEHLPRNG